MKLCYCDETGIGTEPIAVMVGVVVDSQRMHITKDDWDDLLQYLSGIVGARLDELHTRDFYSGNSPFRGIAGPKRSEYISTIFQWFADRKHHLFTQLLIRMLFEARWRCAQYRLKSKLFGGVWVLTSSWRRNVHSRKLKRLKGIQSSFSTMSIARKNTSRNSYSTPSMVRLRRKKVDG